MLSQRELLKTIAASSQEECRRIGELFLHFADKPRDATWAGDFQRQLDALPEQISGRGAVIAEARRRVASAQDDLWQSGWHPLQMQAILQAAGYDGSPGTAPAELDHSQAAEIADSVAGAK